ncbi:adhesin [Actinoplanes sp. NPDC051494]|uniref:adhesin n=1 Tax=Actinoplanes sp. NPDC051494 TaxID=3363907 RepID=UPI0037A35E0A
MRSTVGPLPSAVYWRRRAVVLGALLLGVIVLFVSCSGGDDDSKRGTGASSQAPTPAPASASPEDAPSFVDPPPGAGNPSRPDPEDLQTTAPGSTPSVGAASAGPGGDTGGAEGVPASAGAGTADGANTAVTQPADGSCGDTEISLTPIPASTTVGRGAPVEIRLKIKNVSARACKRDLGADLQEIYIESGAQKIWSSDTCSTVRGSDVQQLAPNSEREFNVTWNGHQSTKCTAGLAAGTAPAAGQYQVRARLDHKVSNPVTLNVSA